MKVNTLAIENLITVYNQADIELKKWYRRNNAASDRLNAFREAKSLIDMHNDDCWWMVDRAESWGFKADAEEWAAKTVKPLESIEQFNYTGYLSSHDMTKWMN